MFAYGIDLNDQKIKFYVLFWIGKTYLYFMKEYIYIDLIYKYYNL